MEAAPISRKEAYALMDSGHPSAAPFDVAEEAAMFPPTVMIVSDVLLYREGLAASLARDGRIRVSAVVTSGEALDAVSEHSPDALLLDAGATAALELARNLRGLAAGLRIVGFGISGGTDRLVDCAESGLAGFVDSSGDVDTLVNAIFGALRGELVCSPRVSALLCERLARLSAGSTPATGLTRREQDVAWLIARGLSNKEIARDLRIGCSTVKNHVHSILEKLRVPRRSAIVPRLHRTR